MPRQQIIWSALPNGFKDETGRILQLSVLVSPRLRFDDGQETGTLDAFPDFLDWPARLRAGGVTFKVIVDSAGSESLPPIDAVIVTRHEPDSDLWKALFGAATPVRTHKFEAINEPYNTYPAGRLASSLSDGYGKVGCDVPYRSPDRAALTGAFPSVAEALSRHRTAARPAILDRIKDADSLDEALLEQAHRDLGETLLRHDPGVSFDEKLIAATTIAGRLARSAGVPRGVPIVPRTNSGASAVAAFAAFHGRPRRPGRNPNGPPSDQAAESREFHRMLSALGEYPELLRRLGLVIDLEVSGDLPVSLAGHLKRLRVEPAFTPAAPPNEAYVPVTNYLHDVRPTGSLLPFPLFCAAPRGAVTQSPSIVGLEIVAGLLNLRIPAPDNVQAVQFEMIQIDVDGALKKVINALDSQALDDGHPHQPIDKAAEAPAPAFRTAGVSLVRFGHAEELVQGIHTAGRHEDALQKGQRAEFFAEDLVRGYRIDVRRFPAGFHVGGDSLPPWMSLHKRTGTFIFKRPPASDLELTGLDDEGFVQPAFMQDLPGEVPAANPVYIHESLFHWQGWCLSAPPPGTPVDLAPDSATTLTAPGPQHVEIEFEPAPSSLPRLRFGSSYQLRARTVDLAGNGPTVESANGIFAALATHQTVQPLLPLDPLEFVYRRYEPLASPTLVLRERLTEGETIDVMVIRSNGPSTSTAAYAAGLGDPRYKAVNERHILPPKTAQRSAEMHGALDGGFGPGSDPVKQYKICQRESGSLTDPFVTNLQTGEPEPLPDVIIRDPATGAGTTISHGIVFVPVEGAGSSPDVTSLADPQANGGYAIHYEAQLRLPYLPDPLARGASLFGLPGVEDGSAQLDDRGNLVFSGSDGQLLEQKAIDDLGCVTKIGFSPSGAWPEFLPFRLRLDGTDASSSVKPEWSQVQGTRVLTVRLPPGETKTVWISTYPDKNDIPLFGLHGWFTKRIGAQSGPRHFLNVAQHGALAMLSPARKLTLVHAVQQPVTAPVPDPSVPFGVDRIKVGDTVAYVRGAFTIHSGSTAKLDLLATWMERGEGPGGDDPRPVNTHVFEVPIHLGSPSVEVNGQPVPIAEYGKDTGMLRVSFRAPGSAGIDGKRWLARHEFGDTKYRNVTYHVVATTRFREYFPTRIVDHSDLTRRTCIAKVIVRSSARPPVPTISHVVPAFKWNERLDGLDLIESTRRGGGLRVYLGERWHASGDDERLAVVDAPSWGADALHFSRTAPTSRLVPAVAAVPVPGSAAGVQIYPYPVYYDKETRQWYSDITFDVRGSYFPFIKLALARYQEHSLKDLHLSRVVQAGIHQLAPNRTVTLEHTDFVEHQPTMRKITIAVTGSDPTPAQSPSGSIGHVIDVSLEERAEPHPDDDLGWTLTPPPQQPVAGSPSIPSPVLWTGAVLVPKFPGSKQFRVVVREFEVFPPSQAPPGQGWIGETAGAPRKRLVYADTIVV